MQRIEPEEMGRIIRQFQDGTGRRVISRFEGFVDRFDMKDEALAFPREHCARMRNVPPIARSGRRLPSLILMGSFTTPTGREVGGAHRDRQRPGKSLGQDRRTWRGARADRHGEVVTSLRACRGDRLPQTA